MDGKESEWLKGLKFAEQVGPKEAYNMTCMNEFDSGEFLSGVLDYIEYYEVRLSQ